MFGTRTTGRYSTAPADALPTAAVSPTLRRFGITTPCAPAHSAVRMIAPRLCGSAISSQTIRNGGSPRLSASAKISSVSENACTAATAAMPWWFSPPHIASSFRASTSLTATPASFAMRRIACTEPVRSPRRT